MRRPRLTFGRVAADDAGNVYAATGAPARVYRITPDGKATIIFEPQELQVQTLEVGPGGVIYAATAPDGKVYKIEHKAGEQTGASLTTRLEKESRDRCRQACARSVVEFLRLFCAGNEIHLGSCCSTSQGTFTSRPAITGRSTKSLPKGEHSLFFKSDETHIRVLALDAQGNVIAGTDGSGLVYRISPAGEAFVLYSAPKKEITALALDHDGNIYAAGVGEKRSGFGTSRASARLRPSITIGTEAPADGDRQSPGCTRIGRRLAAVQMGPFPFPGGGASGGSDVYRIAPDGSPSRIWTSQKTSSMRWPSIRMTTCWPAPETADTFSRSTGQDEFSDLLKAAASQVTGFAKAPGGGLYAASSNLGKIFVLGPGPESEGTYESDVFDAKIFSRWGRAEFRGAGNVELLARSGNVDNPDRNWSAWKKVDLGKDAEMTVPAARYAQWKAVLHAGTMKPAVNSVTLNYLPKNVAPEIDDVSVQMGVRYQPLPKSSGLSLGSDFERIVGRTLRFARAEQSRS